MLTSWLKLSQNLNLAFWFCCDDFCSGHCFDLPRCTHVYPVPLVCLALCLVPQDTKGEDFEDEFVFEELIFYLGDPNTSLPRKRFSDVQENLMKPQCYMGETNTLDFSVTAGVAVLRWLQNIWRKPLGGDALDCFWVPGFMTGNLVERESTI